jgi:hypothetical protein
VMQAAPSAVSTFPETCYRRLRRHPEAVPSNRR